MVFLIGFGLYTGVVLCVLLLGLGAAVAASSPAAAAAYASWGQEGELLDSAWRSMAAAARFSEPPGQVTLDYLVSALNLGLGVFLAWRRRDDKVARLLALGMVGSAGAFNLQAHTIYVAVPRAAPELRFLLPVHWMLHAVSGVTYLHALLLFPNGRLVPRRFVWLLRLAYLVAVEECIVALASGSGGLVALPFRLTSSPGLDDPALFGRFVRQDTTFLVLFFGVLLPLVGGTSQVYRYLVVASRAERERTRLVVWALLLALAAGLLLVLIAMLTSGVQGAGLPAGSLLRAEDVAFRLAAPLFALVPLALVLAMLRHGLFDMDLVVNRTLVYGGLTAALAGVFVVSVIVLQQVLKGIVGGPPELAYAGAGAVNIALFQPLRRRIQTGIERRVDRARRTRQAALLAFRASLRDEPDLDLAALEARLLAAVDGAVQPSNVQLWLREAGE